MFPNISSEIGLFSARERNGDELADRQFLLTFDDGPTASNGNSDRLLVALTEQKLSAHLLCARQQFAGPPAKDVRSGAATFVCRSVCRDAWLGA